VLASVLYPDLDIDAADWERVWLHAESPPDPTAVSAE